MSTPASPERSRPGALPGDPPRPAAIDAAARPPSGPELLELSGTAVAAGWLAIPAAAAALALAIAAFLRPLAEALRRDPTPQQLPLRAAADAFRPEPGEQALYLICLAVPPLVVWGLSRAARRLPRPSGATLTRASVAVQAALAMAIVFTFAYQGIELHDYFPVERWALGLAAVVAVLAGARASRRSLEGRAAAAPVLRASVLLAAALAAAYAAARLASVVYDDASIFGAPRTVSYHLPYTLSEFAAVLNGRSPGEDFFPQYVSILPYALAPFFRIAGLTVHTFTLAMAALSFLGLVLQYDVLRRVTARPWTALALYVPFVALGFQPVEAFPDGNVASAFGYFAVGPLRYFGPWVVGWLVAWYLSRPSARRAWLVFAAAGASAINNLDWGIPALGGAALALGLTAVTRERPGRSLLALFPAAIGGTVAAFLAFEVLTLLHSGHLANVPEMTVFQRAFAVLGFGMLPLPPWGIHWVVYLTFVLGIGTAVVRLEALRAAGRSCPDDVARRERLVDGVLLYGSVFGAGALSYFIGRSHWAVLPAVFAAWGFVLVVLAWLALRAAARSWRRDRVAAVPAVLAAAALALCAGEALPWRAPLTELYGLDVATGAQSVWHVVEAPRNAAILRTFAAPGEKVMISMPAGHLVAYLAGVEDVFPFVDWGSCVIAGQIDEIVAEMRASGVTKFFGPAWPELRAKVAAERLPVVFVPDEPDPGGG